jgi:hypothetical protein
MPTFLSDLWRAIQDNIPWVLILLIITVFLVVYRRDFPSLIRRAKRVKFPGGFEFEFYEDLRRAQELAEQAASEVASTQTDQSLSATSAAASDLEGDLTVTTGSGTATSDDIVESILKEAASEPKLALMRLSTAIEREIGKLLARSGHHRGRPYIPLLQAVEIIRRRYPVLPETVLSAIDAFWKVRNQIVHGGEGDRDDVLRALDSGLVVLKTLYGMPQPKYVIHHPGVPVYADSEGREVREGVTAVILEHISAGGLVRTKRVHPTTRSHFREGMEVAWEWNDQTVWGESWYRDPDTGKAEYAWTESMEFVGRDLDALDTGAGSPPASA